MIKIEALNKIKGYVGLANRAGYVIFGTDNLKGYTHKLYLIICRRDYGKTIEKTISSLAKSNATLIVLEQDDFNHILGTDKCKLFGIKNKGLSDQIINILRSENIG